ncbi:MAG: histidine--tRNA ligase [Chitinophagaceae bacterium]|nr:histidine--tRNA ligase [Chitinophagaceae bacterium]MBK9463940.1 histidine--tRNA ligase [Chitinophagaceae bacterium]MBP6231626.1 histidine--tRNA ligase [Chitinophagaceae bacterium]MBP6415407.1 histidine--tRNA ligase [Chitinophagaceae bacterium]HQW42768.1 histidine--tRNA ligase [Chitinophagaceae bacterium]
MAKPSLPQGTRDFGPDIVRKRTYILNTIRPVFELYGFQPLETPAMENLDTLMGKYGEEGDKLIFKILNNGLDNKEKEKQAREDFEKVLLGKNTKGITERALKYDLTIPFARYVAMNHGQITFPFKRYQIQPVWRADRPQKGRYREFYQCDADVVGSNSLLNEMELASIYHEVFTRLGLTTYELKINHRKILTALAEICGGANKITDITIAIDKLDKIGIEKVKEELSQRGLVPEQINFIEKYLSIKGKNEDVLTALKTLLGNNETGKIGIEEIEYLLANLKQQAVNITIDPTLARGLNYYTGVIFEAKAPADVKIGSIGGGGRYDDLTGLFGVPNIPGVGISFGVDRIYDVLEELDLFPADVHTGTQVLFFNLGEAESKLAFNLMQQLRQKGVRSELYHEQAKFDKQFKYAEKKNIPFVIIIGEKELQETTCNIKNLATGQQETISTGSLLTYSF